MQKSSWKSIGEPGFKLKVIFIAQLLISVGTWKLTAMCFLRISSETCLLHVFTSSPGLYSRVEIITNCLLGHGTKFSLMPAVTLLKLKAQTITSIALAAAKRKFLRHERLFLPPHPTMAPSR